MKAYRKFKYFLLVIDVFSWKIFARPLVSKKALVVRRNLIEILDSIDSPVTQLVTDFGSEFLANKDFLRQRHILYRPKYNQRHKAAIAEHGIFLVKTKLYKLMRHYKTKDWVKLLPDAVNLLNSQGMERNGFVPANEINSFLDDPILRKARLEHHIEFPQPNRESEKTQEERHQMLNHDFKVGAYVYLDKKPKVFDKSFTLQVR